MHFSHISDETYRKSAVMLFIRHRITEAPSPTSPLRAASLHRRSRVRCSRLEPHHRCGSSLLSAPRQGGRRQCSRPRIVGQNVQPPPLSAPSRPFREVTETQPGNRYRTRRWSRLSAKQLPLLRTWARGESRTRVTGAVVVMDRQKNARHRVSKIPRKIPKKMGPNCPYFGSENLPTFPTQRTHSKEK